MGSLSPRPLAIFLAKKIAGMEGGRVGATAFGERGAPRGAETCFASLGVEGVRKLTKGAVPPHRGAETCFASLDIEGRA